MKASTRLFRSAATIALAVSTALAVSSCGAGEPGVASTGDGQVVTESDLDAVVADFGKVQGAEAPTRTQVLSLLTLRPYLLQAPGAQVPSEAIVRSQVGSRIPDLSDPTVRLLQANAVAQSLDQNSTGRLLQQLQHADIQVSPRYGTFDPKTAAIEPVTPNWIAPASGTGDPAQPPTDG